MTQFVTYSFAASLAIVSFLSFLGMFKHLNDRDAERLGKACLLWLFCGLLAVAVVQF
jgi:heme/copper-type cytochrome/quinol oxidase subunit 4